ncbi:DUF1707 domain-containing protein [Dactylosporangium sp. NBC_01737]|nr:DUF1707 domain-containing protein [Dactylosporangium sp. NBC_01737]
MGRLSLDEFADRCDTVLAAKTLDALVAAILLGLVYAAFH